MVSHYWGTVAYVSARRSCTTCSPSASTCATMASRWCGEGFEEKAIDGLHSGLPFQVTNAVGAHQHRPRFGPARLDLRGERHAGHAGHVVVGNQERYVTLCQLGKRLLAIGNRHNLVPVNRPCARDGSVDIASAGRHPPPGRSVGAEWECSSPPLMFTLWKWNSRELKEANVSKIYAMIPSVRRFDGTPRPFLLLFGTSNLPYDGTEYRTVVA